MPSPADDDWRLTVRFESDAHALHVFSGLREHAAAALAAGRLKEGVVAEHDGEWLRIYASSEDGLRRAQEIVATAMDAEGVQTAESAEHHDGRSWQPIELPPMRDATHVIEHHGAGPRVASPGATPRPWSRTPWLQASACGCRLRTRPRRRGGALPVNVGASARVTPVRRSHMAVLGRAVVSTSRCSRARGTLRVADRPFQRHRRLRSRGVAVTAHKSVLVPRRERLARGLIRGGHPT